MRRGLHGGDGPLATLPVTLVAEAQVLSVGYNNANPHTSAKVSFLGCIPMIYVLKGIPLACSLNLRHLIIQLWAKSLTFTSTIGNLLSCVIIYGNVVCRRVSGLITSADL